MDVWEGCQSEREGGGKIERVCVHHFLAVCRRLFSVISPSPSTPSDPQLFILAIYSHHHYYSHGHHHLGHSPQNLSLPSPASQNQCHSKPIAAI